jgi:hypothetical protein
LNIIGPFDVSFIRIAIISNTGDRQIIKKTDILISIIFLMARAKELCGILIKVRNF